jgi:hypothetical protein
MNEGEEFLAGSPDGITASGKLIEVKCPYFRTPEDFVPEIYVYQIQMLMHILRLGSCDFIQYVPETEWKPEVFIVTHVKYDPIFWGQVFPKMETCWQEILDIREYQRIHGIKKEDLGKDDEDDEKDKRNKKRKKKQAEEEGQNVCSKGKVITIPAIPHILMTPFLDDEETTNTNTNENTNSDWSCVNSFFEDAINQRKETLSNK